jgi:citrate synthase
MSDDLYMDAPEAARTLGVTVQTLYAYVSRKGLRSFPVPGTRRRRYWRADILALADTFQPRTDEPAAPSTRITLLTATGTYYRGQDVVDLAERSSVEDVAALLWQAPSEQIFTERLPHAPPMLPALLRWRCCR